MDYQPDRSEEYARSKGWHVVASYADPERTGRNSRRPGLQAMICDIESGRATVVVVHRLDRLYRNLESLLRFLRRHRVRLVSVTEQIDTESWWGRLVLYVLGALAEMYVWQTSVRTREIKQELSRKGLHNGSAPYGYCKGLCSTCEDRNGPGYCPQVGSPDRPESRRGRIPVPHPIDRHAILMAHTLYSEGHSYLEIASLLNTYDYHLPDGQVVRFRTKGILNHAPGRPFQRDSIREIICNDFYAGYVVRRHNPPLDMDDDRSPDANASSLARRLHQGRTSPGRRSVIERNRGQHEAIVPEELWERNQHIRRSRGSAPSNKERPAREYLLSGIACCFECYVHDGRQFGLRGLSTNGHNYYRCAALQEEYSLRGRAGAAAFSNSLKALDLQAAPNGSGQALIARHRSNLRQELMEEQVDRLMESLVIPPEWYDMILAYCLATKGISEYRLRRFNLIKELTQVRDMYRLQALTQAEYESWVVQINRQLNQLQPSAQPEAQSNLPLLRDFKSLWRQMDGTHRKMVLQAMFDGLYFNREHRLCKVAAHSPFDKLLGMGDLDRGETLPS